MRKTAVTSVMQVAGLVCIVVGLGWFSVPLATMVAGVCLVIVGGLL